MIQSEPEFIPTPCIRCGKIRVFKKRWSETNGNSPTIVHTVSVCPDKSCQKILDAEFKAKEEKRKLLAQKREKKVVQT